jgi:two-component system KDP operon response regulator KdpE
LILDNDPRARRALRAMLVEDGFEITDTHDGAAAIGLARSTRFDLLLVDIDAPGKIGIKTCREIRALSGMGIILLAASGAERDKVDALLAGADDCVTKPLNMPELLARIRAVLRRTALSSPKCSHIELNDLEVDFDLRRVKVCGREKRLTPKEFCVLHFLVARANKIVACRELLHAFWGPDYEGTEQCLRDCISRIRKKIEPSPNQPRYLLTVPWVGYRFLWADSGSGMAATMEGMDHSSDTRVEVLSPGGWKVPHHIGLRMSGAARATVNDVLGTPVDVLDLSTRALNVLSRLRIGSVADLLTYPKHRIILAKNMGQKSVDEIESKVFACLSEGAVGVSRGQAQPVSQPVLGE